MESFAAERGFAVGQTPMGLMVAPRVEGKVLSREQYMEIPQEQRDALEKREPEVQEQLQATLRQVRDLELGIKGRLGNLDQEVSASVLAPLFKPLREQYSDCPEVVAFLESTESDLVNRTDRIRAALGGDGEEGISESPPWLATQADSPLDRYLVNVIVDHTSTSGAPVVLETNPTYFNVMGRMEHRAQLGTLVTDFRMIRGGALHRANQGYLVLDAKALLRQPLAWEALKRSLRHKEIRIEDPSQQMGLIPTTTLTPEPIPLDVKVVLIGDAETYYVLYSLDDQFQKLFKVRADFAVDMEWSDQNAAQMARFIHSRCEADGLLHFGPEAVARVLEFGARQVEDQRKLTTRFAHVSDLICESAFWAKQSGRSRVEAEDVQRAIDERDFRSNQVEKRVLDRLTDGTILLDTTGEAVGQVNGLSVMVLGDYQFGRPNRITARTYLGQRGVINIEREARMSGRIHDKGMLILSGYLGGKYAQDAPFSLSASVAFEQSYSGVEGDSASVAEVCALLSSITGIPTKQGLAVTGSINQHGEVQAIGGVNHKIEGFYEVCKALAGGLTGEQGVLIPQSNVRNLMLRDDVVDAVEEGLFHIYPVQSVDEAIALLTGVDAGEIGEDDDYPDDTFNGMVISKLRDLAERLKAFGRDDEKKGEADLEAEGSTDGDEPQVVDDESEDDGE